MPNIAYVNGQFSALEEATIPVEDRGFQFGDGVYEVVRTYGGVPFRLYDHLSRLESELPGPCPSRSRSPEPSGRR